ncbi:MAG: beta-phosphoglucomutase [Flavobacteriaceae bacterium]|nr:beta-phosphoglucomutase [Flavobacteriaceae bacterium]
MKGFIFDLDGVIVDTAKYHYLAWRKMANTLGFDISLQQNEQLKGVSRKLSLQRILKWGNYKATESEFEELMAKKNEDYLNYIHQMDQSEILPNVKESLAYLRSKGAKIALGSASKNAGIILEKMALTNFFDAVVDGNAVSNTKPDPEVFLIAAKLLDTPADSCVVFEDATAGIEAANAAKMLSIGIGNEQDLQEAKHVFTGFDQVSNRFLDLLLKS